MKIIPGGTVRLIDRNYTDTVRFKTRGAVFHATGAKNSKSQYGWFNTPGANASSHVDVARDGSFEQYVDADKISWHGAEANGTMLGWEFENTGYEEYTPEQLGTALYLMQWASAAYGIPVREMQNSGAGESGFGWHRQGVPYRYNKETGEVTAYAPGYYEAGTQLWSRSSGKICPGDKVIGQIKKLIKLLQDNPEAKYKIGVFMYSPMEGRFTSGFRTKSRPTHEGVDIAPPVPGTVGSPVAAAFGGRAIRVVSGRVHDRSANQALNAGKRVLVKYRTGNGIAIQNPDGEIQIYNHVNPSIVEGEQIAAGQVIGKTDRSGNQTGPHLHFETWATGSTLANPKPFDPMILFKKYGIEIGAPLAKAANTYVSVNDMARLAQVADSSGKIYYSGLLDEVAGPMWEDSVRRFQSDNGLVVDGDFGNISREKFDNKYRGHFTMVQTYLRGLKKPDGSAYYRGLIDGVAGKMTYDSVREFQSDQGLYLDSHWGSVTDAAYWNAYHVQNEHLPELPEDKDIPEDTPEEEEDPQGEEPDHSGGEEEVTVPVFDITPYFEQLAELMRETLKEGINAIQITSE